MPGCCGPSSSPTRTSRCSRPWPGTTRVRSSSSSCPRIIRADWAMPCCEPKTSWPAHHSSLSCRTTSSRAPTPRQPCWPPTVPAASPLFCWLKSSTRMRGSKGRHRPGGGAKGGRRQPSGYRGGGQGGRPVRHRGRAGGGHADRPNRLPGGYLQGALEEVGRGLGPGVELDDVPVLQRLARRDALAGVISAARFFDVGVPEGYREAVAAFPARA